jgi:hypothetical protein
MGNGKTIKIFLENGDVSGIQHAEIVNWTGQATSVPRIKINLLTEWEETMKPGVYFLFGIDEKTGNKAVYIGESEDVSKRIKDHLKTKDFWNEVVFFTNKDENLTKSHIGYLESRLITITSEADRYVVINQNNSNIPTLPRSDRAAMEEFINNIKILLGALGHKPLESLAAYKKINFKNDVEISNETKEIFYINQKTITASALLTSEGIVVLKGSEVGQVVAASLSNGYKEKRNELINEAIIKLEKNQLYFTKDYLFTSSSQAAGIILGYSVSGPKLWKTKAGKTLKQFEEELLK